jgi:hypothetical protein
MEFWEAIEQVGAVRALKTSFFAYPILNALHIMSIGALWTSVLLMDLRILGAFADLEQAVLVKLLRRAALTGFCGALLTGPLLFAVRASEYATMPVFLAKMALIVLAVLNFVLFQLLAARGEKDTGGFLGFLAAASIALWTGVIFAGRFIGFV